jgi:hypothetical protein
MRSHIYLPQESHHRDEFRQNVKLSTAQQSTHRL